MDWYDDDYRAVEFKLAADTIGVPVTAILFVIDALSVTPQYVGEEPGDIEDEGRNCSAAELCRTVPAYARDLFGVESHAALREMGILTSDDLGKIVFALVDKGFLLTSPEDRLDDFLGMCQFVEAIDNT